MHIFNSKIEHINLKIKNIHNLALIAKRIVTRYMQIWAYTAMKKNIYLGQMRLIPVKG